MEQIQSLSVTLNNTDLLIFLFYANVAVSQGDIRKVIGYPTHSSELWGIKNRLIDKFIEQPSIELTRLSTGYLKI